jgi:valyl-tRNA synthetase
MKAAWPRPRTYVSDPDRLAAAEEEMAFVVEIITGIRNIRGEMNIAPSAKLQAAVASAQEEKRRIAADYQDLVVNLARLESLSIQEDESHSSTAATAIVDDAVLLVELKGVVDFAQEAQRLEKEIGKLAKDLAGFEKKLSNPGFLNKAPAEVVAEVREKQALMSEKREKLAATLEKVKSFI